MSYKIAKITTFYPGYLGNLSARLPIPDAAGYQEGLDRLMSDSFSWADFYQRSLRKRGIEAFEIVANAAIVQAKWARENGSTATGKELVLEQLKAIRPDVVFCQDSFRFGGDWVQELRRAVPSVRLVLGWCCAPYRSADLEGFRAFDLLLTCTPGFFQQFESQGFPVRLLHHCFDPLVLERVGKVGARSTDFSFLGSLIGYKDYHQGRIELIVRLLESGARMEVFSELVEEHVVRLWARRFVYLGWKGAASLGLEGPLKNVPVFGKAAGWESWPAAAFLPRRLRQVCQPPVYGLEMFRALARSKIVFNNHIDSSGDSAGNIRMFEVTGMGACLLTDAKKNNSDFFEVDREVVTYGSAEECAEKVKWLVEHPKECAEIGSAGQRRCLRDHTFDRRAETLDLLIRKAL